MLCLFFKVLKSYFCKVFCKLGLGLGKWQWRLSSGQKSCAGAGCIDNAFFKIISWASSLPLNKIPNNNNSVVENCPA